MCGAVLLAGAVITALIFSTEPTATRVAATKKTAMLVQVTKVNRGTYRPTAKNKPVASLYPDLGFVADDGGDGEGGAAYLLDGLEKPVARTFAKIVGAP